MTIHLKADHEQWLSQQVAEGRFASVDEAVAQAIEALRIEAEGEDDEWVRPYLEEAEASIARGEEIPGDVFLAELRERTAQFRLQVK